MQWIIRNAEKGDIKQIYKIEKNVEKRWAASQKTLLTRQRMFPTGFLVAEVGTKIVGYIESCLWIKSPFDASDRVRFIDIKDFPERHNPHGKILYGIYLAVERNYRRMGVGSSLVKELIEYANEHMLKKIQLVALPKRVGFYKRLGFEAGKFLPNFLPASYSPDAKQARLMEYKLIYYTKRYKNFMTM